MARFSGVAVGMSTVGRLRRALVRFDTLTWLTGARATIKFGASDPHWWHERIFLYPVSGSEYVILTPGGHRYVESESDYSHIVPIDLC